jgi:hypothetical protein
LLAERVGIGPVIAGAGAAAAGGWVWRSPQRSERKRLTPYQVSRASVFTIPEPVRGLRAVSVHEESLRAIEHVSVAMLARSCWRRCSSHDSSMNTST